MNSEFPSQYISLREAAKSSPYSQEYLSLRARQGKLRAEKRGRNWVTKPEWLDEYIARSEEYRQGEGRKVPPPANLPTREAGKRPLAQEISGRSILLLRETVRVTVVATLAAALVFASFSWGKEVPTLARAAAQIPEGISLRVEAFSGGFGYSVRNAQRSASSSVRTFSAGFDRSLVSLVRSPQLTAASDRIQDNTRFLLSQGMQNQQGSVAESFGLFLQTITAR